ncbi:MAG: hypothetical protein EPN23_05145 [Verrucomicrobia bacterium]|nr:MAG: hypothetical protein EPN23_05145 [Verrucomicrobiota bacterium]
MKRIARIISAGLVMSALAAWAAVVPPPPVPQPGGIAKGTVVLKKLESQKLLTPEYSVRPTPPASKIQRNWHEITVHFDTHPEWLDDLDLKCYVLLKAKVGAQGPRQMLLRGDVTLVNIAKGKHKADFFVHPSTLLRYGDVDAVAVVVLKQDLLIGMLSQPPSAKRWWEDYQPVSGLVLKRSDTPFALINYDDYEQVKETPAGGTR